MLLKKNDRPTRDDGEFTHAHRTGGKARSLIFPKRSELEERLGAIEKDETIHVLTRSSWSTPHLIDHLIRQIGPAEVYVSTWSVKEQAVRTLLRLLDSGAITRLHGLFDERIRVQCPQAHQLIESQLTDIRLTKIHAKLTVLINNAWAVGISASANLTRNPRIESYVISSHRAIAEFYRDTIVAELNEANPFSI